MKQREYPTAPVYCAAKIFERFKIVNNSPYDVFKVPFHTGPHFLIFILPPFDAVAALFSVQLNNDRVGLLNSRWGTSEFHLVFRSLPCSGISHSSGYGVNFRPAWASQIPHSLCSITRFDYLLIRTSLGFVSTIVPRNYLRTSIHLRGSGICTGGNGSKEQFRRPVQGVERASPSSLRWQ